MLLKILSLIHSLSIQNQVVGAGDYLRPTKHGNSPGKLPPASPEGYQVISRPAERYNPSSKSWVYSGVSSKLDMFATNPSGDI